MPIIALVVAAAVWTPADGYLETVVSPTYEAPGSAQVLARKGKVCMGKIVRPGIITAPTILAEDIEGGKVVAGLSYGFAEKVKRSRMTFDGRAKLTFEAKDGRFRIVGDEIEMRAFSSGWIKTPRPLTQQDGYADAVILRVAQDVATCVQATEEDW